MLLLAPPGLMPHLLTCVAQPVAVRELGSYRLLTLEKPHAQASRRLRTESRLP